MAKFGRLPPNSVSKGSAAIPRPAIPESWLKNARRVPGIRAIVFCFARRMGWA
jgi:hypothetical protein